MTESFCIRSTQSKRTLTFCAIDAEHFRAALSGDINARANVYGYSPHAPELSRWFDELGNHLVPWTNQLSWASLEGEFGISATCTATGHIHFIVELSGLPSSVEEAHIRACIETEFGQLPAIVRGARRFFSRKSTQQNGEGGLPGSSSR